MYPGGAVTEKAQPTLLPYVSVGFVMRRYGASGGERDADTKPQFAPHVFAAPPRMTVNDIVDGTAATVKPTGGRDVPINESPKSPFVLAPQKETDWPAANECEADVVTIHVFPLERAMLETAN